MTESELKAMKYFIAKGMSVQAAAGLVGNLVRESQLNPASLNKYSGALGIAQWLGTRKQDILSLYGESPTLDLQLDYVWHELNSSHKKALTMLNLAKNYEDAARYGMGYYEFSVGPEGAIREMNKYGLDGLGSMNKGIANAKRLHTEYSRLSGEMQDRERLQRLIDHMERRNKYAILFKQPAVSLSVNKPAVPEYAQFDLRPIQVPNILLDNTDVRRGILANLNRIANDTF